MMLSKHLYCRSVASRARSSYKHRAIDVKAVGRRLSEQHDAPSEVIRPPRNAALTFLRATAGRSKGSRVFSSSCPAPALSALSRGRAPP
jgi:hypothetical protein